MYNKPNPFDEATYLTFFSTVNGGKGTVIIRDISGRELKRIPLEIQSGMNEVLYEHGYGMSGVLNWTLEVDGKVVGSRNMTFAN